MMSTNSVVTNDAAIILPEHLPAKSPFHCCYLLRSLAHRSSTYIGYTSNPLYRLHQHNGDISHGGALRTRRFRPWCMAICVYGFFHKVQALQFEWAWQHPSKTKLLKAAYIDPTGMVANDKVNESKTAEVGTHVFETKPKKKQKPNSSSNLNTNCVSRSTGVGDQNSAYDSKTMLKRSNVSSSRTIYNRIRVLASLLSVKPYSELALKVVVCDKYTLNRDFLNINISDRTVSILKPGSVNRKNHHSNSIESSKTGCFSTSIESDANESIYDCAVSTVVNQTIKKKAFTMLRFPKSVVIQYGDLKDLPTRKRLKRSTSNEKKVEVLKKVKADEFKNVSFNKKSDINIIRLTPSEITTPPSLMHSPAFDNLSISQTRTPGYSMSTYSFCAASINTASAASSTEKSSSFNFLCKRMINSTTSRSRTNTSMNEGNCVYMDKAKSKNILLPLKDRVRLNRVSWNACRIIGTNSNIITSNDNSSHEEIAFLSTLDPLGTDYHNSVSNNAVNASTDNDVVDIVDLT